MNGGRAEVMLGEAQPRGIKRTQGEALDDDQRFAKRFNLLSIDNHAKLYIPVSSRPQQQLQPHARATAHTATTARDDHMQLDDTKDRVYIHSLDDELAELESDEEKVIFLPDIEKQLSKIPKHLLSGGQQQSKEGQELVLYTVPSSISVPAEKDSVRKAIIESRQRARERVSNSSSPPIAGISRALDNPETAHGFDATDYLDTDSQDDPDAMDIS